ncbi:hypothetical protein [Brenneria tiliae]|uniref:hypothetical protein n=1 Tax=Brenneria tiliae TaxID=2914984 RepID=UPI002014F4B7|nr:hypothetical protein [Brenneria tiliae]MCL2898444.1 hypothetical protein [Brenneria tiliae]MCL2903014.1 hypothetical protein [Brenneria tiliae]
MKSQRFFLQRMATPLGEMLMVVDEQRQLHALDWQGYEERLHTLLRRQYRGVQTLLQERPADAELRLAMQAYFDGDLAAVGLERKRWLLEHERKWRRQGV